MRVLIAVRERIKRARANRAASLACPACTYRRQDLRPWLVWRALRGLLRQARARRLAFRALQGSTQRLQQARALTAVPAVIKEVQASQVA